MPRYYMQLRDGTEQMLDPEGLEYADLDALKKAGLVAARDLMSQDMKSGFIDFRLGFEQAVNIRRKVALTSASSPACELLWHSSPHDPS